ncbi:phosphoglycerate kinase [Candidatus Woesearchaeota archaeon]|nr:phosphoglycerate kinase [Candidatus Woesearchaeota archaeon]
MSYLTLDDFDFRDKVVLVRSDLDVPVEKGRVTDDTRLKAASETIRYLQKKKAMIVMLGHMGRPGGKVVEELRLDPVAKRLSKIIGSKIEKLDDCMDEDVETYIDEMVPGEIVMLENLRFYKGEKKNDPDFAKSLADLGHIFVLDAFSVAHRDQASVTGIPRLIPSCAGMSLQQELDAMLPVLRKPKEPVVFIVGGAKLETKLPTIEHFLKKADKVLVGGAMIFTFIRAMGLQIGKSKFEKGLVSQAKKILEKGSNKLVLPVDVVAAEKFDNKANKKTVDIDSIPKGWIGLDIGPKTIKLFSNILKQAKTIIWSGPMGVFEMKSFEKGSREITKVVASSDATTIIGGGDTAAMVSRFKLSNKMTHVSTGGGASLALFEGKKLPAVKALEKNYRRFR